MDSIVFLEKIAWNMYCSFTAMGLLLYVAPFSLVLMLKWKKPPQLLPHMQVLPILAHSCWSLSAQGGLSYGHISIKSYIDRVQEPLIIKRAPFDKKAIISILVIVVMKV